MFYFLRILMQCDTKGFNDDNVGEKSRLKVILSSTCHSATIGSAAFFKNVNELRVFLPRQSVTSWTLWKTVQKFF